jgi:uncharacterized protein
MKTLGGEKFAKSLAVAALAGLLGTGCQTYQQQNKVVQFWRQGNVPAAAVEAQKQADENAGNRNAIIWRLEEGAVLRAAGKFEDSNKAFDLAQQKIDDYAEKAKVRLGQEAGALLSNQAELDYEGRAYDGIMLNTYKALNYLALGDVEKARPELIRAYQRQQDAVEENKRRIEQTQEEARKNKDSAAIQQAENNSQFKAQIQNTMADISGVRSYADYVNPFTVYLDGLYFMANAGDTSDLERAHKSLERVAEFDPENDYAKQDLAAANDLLGGKPLTPTTYVIFETGCAPERGQIRVDIPIIVAKVSYVGAAFPTIKPQGNFQPSLAVSANGMNYATKEIASLDGIVVQDFKNELPVVITKTIAATVVKAVTAYAANQAAQQAGGDWAGLAMQITTAAYQMAVNIADTRTWTTLPKQFQVARFPTPEDRKIHLSAGVQQADVTVEDGAVNLVYVKSINPACPLLVAAMKLNAAPLHSIAAKTVSLNAPAPAEPVSAAAQAPVAEPPEAKPTGTETNTTPGSASNPVNLVPQQGSEEKPVATPAPVEPAPAAPAVPASAPQPPSPEKTGGAQNIANPAVRQLCETLDSSDSRTVIKSLKMLRQLNSPDALPEVLPCLNHPDVRVVREACRTLGVLGDSDTIHLLQPLLVRKEVRGDARAAILRIAKTHHN